MKVHFKILSLSLLLLQLNAEAQDNIHLVKEKSLWLNTENAAGLATSDFIVYNTADLGYRCEKGGFHRMQTGDLSGTANFNTQGSVKVGKVQFWGQFSYDNVTESGTRYNTLVYNPYDERFIYNVADTTLSKWKRQSYEMEFKAAVPIGHRFSGGIHVIYSDKIAAKQNDPRSETTQYYITVKPSALYVFGSSSLGLNATYSHLQERSVPTLSNTSQMQNVFVLRGLGNYTEDMVGSGGLYTMYYSGNSYGGNIQYALDSRIRLLAEAGILLHRTNLRQDAAHPREMGRSDIADCTLGLQLLFGEKKLHKFNLSLAYQNTEGTEYATKQISGVGWEVVSEAVMSNYSTLSAGLDYNFFITEGESWLWDIYAGLHFMNKDDRYVAPYSRFAYTGTSIFAGARKQFLLKKSALAIGLEIEASKNLKGEYVYNGARTGTRPVEEWYPHDLNVLTSDFIRPGATVEWLRRTGGKVSVGFKSGFSCILSDKAGRRLGASLGLALVF